MMLVMVTILAVLAITAWANESGTWNGSNNTTLTNSANWTGASGTIPNGTGTAIIASAARNPDSGSLSCGTLSITSGTLAGSCSVSCTTFNATGGAVNGASVYVSAQGGSLSSTFYLMAGSVSFSANPTINNPLLTGGSLFLNNNSLSVVPTITLASSAYVSIAKASPTVYLSAGSSPSPGGTLYGSGTLTVSGTGSLSSGTFSISGFSKLLWMSSGGVSLSASAYLPPDCSIQNGSWSGGDIAYGSAATLTIGGSTTNWNVNATSQTLSMTGGTFSGGTISTALTMTGGNFANSAVYSGSATPTLTGGTISGGQFSYAGPMRISGTPTITGGSFAWTTVSLSSVNCKIFGGTWSCGTFTVDKAGTTIEGGAFNACTFTATADCIFTSSQNALTFANGCKINATGGCEVVIGKAGWNALTPNNLLCTADSASLVTVSNATIPVQGGRGGAKGGPYLEV